MVAGVSRYAGRVDVLPVHQELPLGQPVVAGFRDGQHRRDLFAFRTARQGFAPDTIDHAVIESEPGVRRLFAFNHCRGRRDFDADIFLFLEGA